MKTVKCPSCGASATNFKNCEYCGSLFVRSVNVESVAAEIFESGKINEVFDNLVDALEENLANQVKYRATDGQIGTWINLDSKGKETLISVFNPDPPPENEEIEIVLEAAELSTQQLMKLRKMKEFELVDSSSKGLLLINCGNDSAGAAYVITQILVTLFDLKLTDKLYFELLLPGDEEKLPVSDEIFSQGEVTITRTIALLEGVSYPINGITAVFVNREEFEYKSLLFGVIILVLAGLSITGDLYNPGWGWQVLAVFLGGIAILGSFHRPYFLMVRTASGEIRCLESADSEFIFSVRSAIETAIAKRG